MEIKRHNTLISVVVFPKVIPFLRDYFDSLIHQTENKFDLLVIYDGIDDLKLPKDYFNIHILKNQQNHSKAELRQDILDFAIKHKFEKLVFSDADDFFSKDRIINSINLLQQSDFVYNDLVPVDKGGNEIDSSLSINYEKKYSSVMDITDYNLFGLSNTAVNVEKLRNIKIPSDVIAIDWWIFTQLLATGAVGQKCDGKTYYRQTGDNTVGISQNLSNDKLKMGIKTKLLHFSYLVKNCTQKEMQLLYTKKFNEIIDLDDRCKDSNFLMKYKQIINNNFQKIYKGWWSEILPYSEWRKYVD